ncbi:hypothetical protein [Caldalkalibacillus mannanilyticus]|uniref:hypothetical protein n=1 Tax=Caldalkalibacillus mannanilyticus TaxID=1418 RepID=UPI000469488B|nr:hypothetical protein [Caldalkalibacillus mannanilyticus]
MNGKIEVFTAGSYLCQEILVQVNTLACPKCEVIEYDLNQKQSKPEWEALAKTYGIQALPSVVLNGRVVDLKRWEK